MNTVESRLHLSIIILIPANKGTEVDVTRWRGLWEMELKEKMETVG